MLTTSKKEKKGGQNCQRIALTKCHFKRMCLAMGTILKLTSSNSRNEYIPYVIVAIQIVTGHL